MIGKDLKPLIIKAINFINNDVKNHLGIKVSSATPNKAKNFKSGEDSLI